MKPSPMSMIGCGWLIACSHATAVTIDFENLAPGVTLSNQYAAQGAVFSANAFAGSGTSSSGQSWASNTNMTVVSSTGTDVSGLGSPSLVQGNILHSYSGWLAENGDASFRISFATPVNFISATFASVATPADVRLYAYNGSALLGTVVGSVVGQFTLSYLSPAITSVVVTPGSYDDWVAVDNIVFAPVPETTTYAMMVLGLATLAVCRRRQA